MNKSKIEWCDYTWNPVTGCLHGCEYCYARRIAERFGEHKVEKGVVELHWKRENPYPYDFYPTFHYTFDWIIVGAQTGPKAMAPKSEWVQEIIDQARDAGKPIFLKDNLHWPWKMREFPEGLK